MADTVFGRVGEPLADTERRVRKAARALDRHGLAHAYGHVSARLDDARFLVCAPKPLGTIAPDDAGTVVPIDGALPDGVLGEVRCHQRIYARRRDIGGICRFFPRKVMSLSALGLTPKARIGFGAYFAPAPPLWDDPMLLRSDEQAVRLAQTLGGARAIVMRGNGAITTGATLEEAAVMAFFLEEAARTELDVLAAHGAGEAALLTDDQAAARATGDGRIYERMWDYMTHRDPE